MSDSDETLERLIADAEGTEEGRREDRAKGEGQASEPGASTGGPPPLRPFGLVLHHDGRWSHEGQPIRNRRLRERFDRAVVYLPDEGKYIVQIGRFRGEIEVEEAGFFVSGVDFDAGTLRLSDGTNEPLDTATLEASPIDGALLCRVKRSLAPEGLPARFSHAAQAELLGAVEEVEEQAEEGEGHPHYAVRLAGVWHPMPEL